MTSEGLGEMFVGDSADTCSGKFSLMSMGGQAEGLACADLGPMTPIRVSGNFGFRSHGLRPRLRFGGLCLVSKIRTR